MLDSIKEEIKQRRNESLNIKRAVEEEKIRLEEQRRAAKSRNPLRKIKIIDKYSTNAEIKRDEKRLSEFRAKEEEIIAKARTERTKEIAQKNSRKIIIAVAILIVLIVSGTMTSRMLEHKKTMDKYNTAIHAIETEDYEVAVANLSEIEIEDSTQLLSFVKILANIDSYQNNPTDLVNDLDAVGKLNEKNEGVIKNYETLYLQATLLKEAEEKISLINNVEVDLDSKEQINEISEILSKISTDYIFLINKGKYDIATLTIENIEKGTPAGRVIKEIHELGAVSLESEEQIERIKELYNNLSANEKEFVTNISLLDDAETTISRLIKEKELKEKADKEEQERKAKEEAEAKEKAEKEAQKQAKYDAIMAEGFDALQTLFITVDNSYSIEEIKKLASKFGLVTNQQEDAGIDGMYLEVSTRPGVLGDGAEIWYKYEVDHATFGYSREGGVHMLSKEYYAQKQLVTVTHRYSNNEISTKNSIAGYYVKRVSETIKDYDSIEDALLYAINYED